MYDGCDSVKGCLGLPGGTCIQERSCSALVTFAQKNERSFEFELWATNSPDNSFVAVGLSDDNKMGDDSVTECTVVNGRVNAFMSRNEAGKSNTRLENVFKQLHSFPVKILILFSFSQPADWMWSTPSTETAICIANLNGRRNLPSAIEKWLCHLKCITCF